jgi:hypothetical protein
MPGLTQRPMTHRLSDLCDYLSVCVLDPFLVSQGVRWNRQFGRFFSPHRDSHPFEPEGTIDFFPPPMFLGQLGQLEGRVRDALDRLGIQCGEFVHEAYADGYALKVIHIPVTRNPTAGPPEVNLSPVAATLVLRDLLGYQPKEGRYEMAAADLARRIAAVSEEQVQTCSCSPVKGNRMPRAVVRTPSPATVQRIRRCLGELRQLAEWAKASGHEQIDAG